MTSFKPIIVSLLLVGLFALALIQGFVTLANDNGETELLAEDSILANYSANLQDNLSTAYTNDYAKADTTFSNSSVSFTASIPFVNAIGGVWKSFRRIPVAVYDLTIGMLKNKILGDEAFNVVIYVLSAIMILTIVVAVWRMIATGDGG